MRADSHAERLATLSRVTRLVACAQGTEHVFDAVAEAAATLLGAAAARVWVVDRTATALRSHGDFAVDPGVKALMAQLPEMALGEGLVGPIVESTRPQYVLDVAADPRWVNRPLVTEAGLRGFAGVPLVTGDQVVGVLAILFRGERHFSPEEQELTRLLADQAAIAIRNTRLFEETERRRRQAESLAALGRAISQTLEPKDVARRIADSVRTLLGTLGSALYVLEPRSGDLIPLAVSGDVGDTAPWTKGWQKGTGAAGVAVRERRPVGTVDVLADERITLTAHQRALIELAPYRAALAVPLLVQDAVIGALGVGDYSGRQFDADDIRLLEAFADQASSALENARLYELAERERRRLQVLNDVSRRLAASHETDEILSLIINEAARLVGADAGGLRLLSDGELVLRACTDSAHAVMARPRLKVGEGLTGLVVASGEAFAVEDLAEYERYAPDLRSAAAKHGLRAGLAVPLRALGQIVGALVLFCKDRRRFMDDEIALLTAFADQSALAIVKDRLLRQAEDRARRLRTLARLNQVVSSSLDLNEVLAAIARAAAEIMRARHASFWVVDQSGQRLTVGAVSDETWWSDYPSPSMSLERGGVTAAVALDQQEIGIADVSGDPRIMAPQWYRAHGLKSYYGIPIVLDGSTVAVLNLAGSAPFSFDADGRDVLESFVAQAAAALRNARLYEERRLANEQLERSQNQLVQTERLRALGEMAAGVAHHFNNLLAIVSGRTQLLLRRAEDGDLRRSLSIIEQAVSDGAQRVRRIQEFTRTRPASPGGHVELSRLLQEVVDLTSSRWKDEAQGRGIHYSVRVEGDDVAVAGAPDELREVFINLLMNALEAMPSGGECTLGVHVEEDCALIQVRDTGAGMSEETRTRAFEPFFSTKGPQGNGLGLAVVWGIVTRYGGTVQIESSPGLGCTFTIRLPLSREAARSTDAPRPAPAVRPARILIVDDEHEVGTILADVLSTIGYSAVHVTTGREGLALCESERFDVILSDLSMPEMSGWQVAAACRERYPGVPVGLVTGWGNQLDPGQLAEHRIRFVLPKPFDVAEVARQVGEALREGATA